MTYVSGSASRVVLSVFVFFFLGTSVASAQFIVDSLGDDGDMTPGDGVCDINEAPPELSDCTLRAAVEEANAFAGAQTISFGLSGIIALVNGVITITDDLTISGQGPQETIIRQDTADSGIFWAGTGPDAPDFMNFENMTLREAQQSAIASGATTGVTIEDCEFHENQATIGTGGAFSTSGVAEINRSLFFMNFGADGGAIQMITGMADVTIRNSEFISNTSNGPGGAIEMDVGSGRLVIHDSRFHDNESTGAIGGAISANGNVEILRSTFTNNLAGVGSGDDGGAIYYLQSTPGGFLFDMQQSVVANNFAGDAGGGIFVLSGDDVSILRSAFISNEALVDGGGIALGNTGGTHEIANSTIAGNTAPIGGGLDLAGIIEMTHLTVYINNGGGIENGTFGTTLSNSVVAKTASMGSGPDCDGTVLTVTDPNMDSDGSCGVSITAADPGLGGLTPALVHPLLPGSPGLDTADGVVCAAPPVLGIDQLGTSRPVGPECDLGAREGAGPFIKDGFENRFSFNAGSSGDITRIPIRTKKE